MPQKPLCFVLMPFGQKPGLGGQLIDFDAIYKDAIAPAIDKAGLEAIRADEETAGGIIHKPMFERLVLCDFAIADLTTANANVFYELGVRHTAKPRTTVLLVALDQGRLPFDVGPLRALPYKIGADGKAEDAPAVAAALVKLLDAARANPGKDSPLYQLLDDYPNIAHEKTEVFRQQVAYAADVKARLLQARAAPASGKAIRDVETSLGNLGNLEAGIVVDLVLSYRDATGWADMVRVVEGADPALAATVLLREQKAFALNRLGKRVEAEAELRYLIAKRGPSSETLGILGRVYKDQWDDARKAGQTAKAAGLLGKVVETYRRGFEADWRDAYPGVNAVTFMQIHDPANPDYPALRAAVGYAVERKIAAGVPDYWDYATRLELAVLDRDQPAAQKALGDALARQRATWEPETTLNNVRLISGARGDQDPARAWVREIETELEQASKPGG